VKSRAAPRFWAAYRELPTDVRDVAQKAYRLFRESPQDPSLQFKGVHERDPIYSVRIVEERGLEGAASHQSARRALAHALSIPAPARRQ